MFQTTLAIILQFALLSFAMAEETVSATGHGNAWKYGSGGGVIGFIVLVLDIIAILEILKSGRPPIHKLLWCLVVFLFPIIGLVAYYLLSNRASHNGGSGYETIV